MKEKEAIKKIIYKEITNLIEAKNKLYVFDFDDTLVTDKKAKMWIITPSGKRRSIDPSEYYKYEFQPNELIDVSEFYGLINPVVHHSILDLLKTYLEDSVILTARHDPIPVRQFMDRLGVKVPRIAAVGVKQPTSGTLKVNAKKKRDWIEKEIIENNVNYVEVWEDNEDNIDAIKSLQKKYPNVEIITHYVDHPERN